MDDPHDEVGRRTEGQPGAELLAERVARLEGEVRGLRAELNGVHAFLQGRVAPVGSTPTQPMPLPATQQPLRQGQSLAGGPVVMPTLQTPAFGSGAPKESLESQFGAKVLSKVAVLLLLIGAAWFLKWAFDNRWIGAGGRVLIGLLAGVGIVLWSERFRRQGMLAFSYALKAVGSGVLYLSLWASFHLYHLVPSWVAFGAMIAVTLWNVVMAWSQDAELLAGYALAGAYLTPLLLSTGGDHEIFLFSYLAVIAASLLALLGAKPWNALLLGALPVTAGYFVAWYVGYFRSPTNAWLTAGFALLLWAVFAATPLVAKAREQVIAAILVPLGAAVFGALAIYSVLADSGGKEWEPWCAVGFGAVYLLLSRWRKGTASAIHLSLAIVFLTVAIPLKATGRGITLGWLVEAVALLWVSTLSTVEARAQTAMRWLGSGALLLGVAGALVEPWWLGHMQTAFANREFLTALGAGVALAATMVLSRRMTGRGRLSGEALGASALVLLNFVLVTAMAREIFRYFGTGYESESRANFCLSGWMAVQGAVMLAGGFWRRVPLARWLGLFLLAVTVLKAFVYDLRGLGTGYRVASYLGLGVLLMGVSFAYQKDWLGCGMRWRQNRMASLDENAGMPGGGASVAGNAGEWNGAGRRARTLSVCPGAAAAGRSERRSVCGGGWDFVRACRRALECDAAVCGNNGRAVCADGERLAGAGD